MRGIKSNFENLRTRTKLIACFFGIGFFSSLLGVISIIGMSQLSERTDLIYKNNLVPIEMLSDLRDELQQNVTFVAGHILAYDSASVAKQADNIAKVDEQVEQLLKAYAPTIASDTDRKYYEAFRSGWMEYKEVRAKVLTLSTNFSKDAASELRQSTLADKLGVLRTALDQLIKENERLAKDSFETGRRMSSILSTLVVVFCLVAAGLSLLSSWAATRFFAQGLGNVLTAAQQLRNGNLSFRSTVTTQEEIGQLAQAFNQMAGALETAAAKQAEALAVQSAEISGVTNAIDKSQAVIEFLLDGTVLTANENFLRCVGYSLDEIKGKPYRMFCDSTHTATGNCAALWEKLARGEFDAGMYRWLGRDGKEIWFQSSYNPIMDSKGKVSRIMICATDVTTSTQQNAEYEGKISAIMQLQAVIEFNLDGMILAANANFLQCTGYTSDEIRGRHHRMFCDPAYAMSSEYVAFWQKLHRGEFDAGVYQRFGKGGKEMWLHASYTPIRNANGAVYKVVKYAVDVTRQKRVQTEMERLVGESQAVLGKLAVNDLTQEMAGTYSDELAKIKNSINSVVQNLRLTISSVRKAAEQVSTDSENITRGGEDLSHRTSEQAASLEETSASMEEMTATVKQNADSANRANELAIAARDTADDGLVVTQKAIEAMSEINKSGKQIADIITVIDEIAFQTNLLALNAAVEAARAGEHGRGFAVVAAEVRNLAQRSALAAKEITGLITESIQRVTDGSELVNQSGKKLDDIVNAVKRVTNIIAEISTASQEQAKGVDQVNKAILSMDQTTQQNVRLVDETTLATQSMKEQAHELLAQISEFKTNESEPRIGAETVVRMGGSRATVQPKERLMTRSSEKVRSIKRPLPSGAPSPLPMAVGLASEKERPHCNYGGEEFEEF